MDKRTFFMASLFVGSLFFGGRTLWVRELQTWAPIEADVSRVWSKTFTQPPMQRKYGPPIPPREVSVSWISYSYVVDGRRYSGDAPRSYPRGGRVTVFYDPDHPGWSRLDRPRPHASVEIVAGLLFLGGAVLWLGGRRAQDAVGLSDTRGQS